MKQIVIMGAGGFAKEVAWLIEEINQVSQQWNLLGFVDANSEYIGKSVGKYTIIGDDGYIVDTADEMHVVIGIGNPTLLHKIRSGLCANVNLIFPNLIHPSVIWDTERVNIGMGNIICAGNILTTDINIGNFNILNLSSTYGHDSKIGDCNIINPGVNLSGGVTVGDRCLIGTGAVILENLSLADGTVVGGGAVVTKDITVSNTTVVGIPAKPLPKSLVHSTL